MNLWEILKTSKGLPPTDLETLLFARKISGQAVGGSSLKMLTVSGYPCVLKGSVGMPAVDYKIYGNTIQSEEMAYPDLLDSEGYQLIDADDYELCSDDTPEYLIQSVGELVTGGEFSEKYVIPVVTNTENREPLATNIYLDAPLKTGDILKYPENIIEHANGTTESISLPQLPTLNGTTVISTDTEIQPSNIEITYKARR